MEVCRLCLDLATESDVKKLEGTYRDATQIVLPEVNTDISSSPVICQQCTSSLDELYAFKASVVEAEHQIKEKVGDDKCQLRLKEVMTGVKMDEKNTELGKSKDRMCRTCLCAIEGETFTVLKPTQSDAYLNSMLLMCLPEMDLELTLDPVMCEQCLCNLQKLYHFKSSCLDVEERLNNYCQQHGTSSSSQINLHSVLEEDAAEPKDNIFAGVKSEPIDSSVGDYKIEEDDEDVSMSDNSKDLGYTVVKVKKEERDTILKEEDDTEDGDESMGDDADNMTDEEIGQLKQEELKIEDDDGDGTKKSKKNKKKYNCDLCPFSTNYRRNLTTHVGQKHEKKRYPSSPKKCPQPDCTFTSYENFLMSEHLLRVHNVEPETYAVYRCNLCEYKTLLKTAVKRHLITHTEIRNYKCPHCPYSSKTSNTLKVHVLTHQKSVEKTYKCENCCFSTIYSSCLNRHMKYVHEKQHKQCDRCDFKCRSWTMMKKHQLFHDNPEAKMMEKVKCEQCGQILHKYSISRHMKYKHEDLPDLECNLCDYKTKRKLTIKRHMDMHKGKEKLECDQCEFKSWSSYKMNVHHSTHTERVKTKPRKVECEICAEVLREVSIKKHMQLMHQRDSVPEFECPECGLKSKHKHNLKRHIARHNRKGGVQLRRRKDVAKKTMRSNDNDEEPLNYLLSQSAVTTELS